MPFQIKIKCIEIFWEKWKVVFFVPHATRKNRGVKRLTTFEHHMLWQNLTNGERVWVYRAWLVNSLLRRYFGPIRSFVFPNLFKLIHSCFSRMYFQMVYFSFSMLSLSNHLASVRMIKAVRTFMKMTFLGNCVLTNGIVFKEWIKFVNFYPTQKFVNVDYRYLLCRRCLKPVSSVKALELFSTSWKIFFFWLYLSVFSGLSCHLVKAKFFALKVRSKFDYACLRLPRDIFFWFTVQVKNPSSCPLQFYEITA